jgi:hypothetical protein
MKIETTNIKETLSYKLVSEEARYLSMKMQNTIFIIQRGSTLFTSLSKEEGVILSSWNLGNQIFNS